MLHVLLHCTKLFFVECLALVFSVAFEDCHFTRIRLPLHHYQDLVAIKFCAAASLTGTEGTNWAKFSTHERVARINQYFIVGYNFRSQPHSPLKGRCTQPCTDESALYSNDVSRTVCDLATEEHRRARVGLLLQLRRKRLPHFSHKLYLTSFLRGTCSCKVSGLSQHSTEDRSPNRSRRFESFVSSNGMQQQNLQWFAVSVQCDSHALGHCPAIKESQTQTRSSRLLLDKTMPGHKASLASPRHYCCLWLEPNHPADLLKTI